MDRVVRFFAKVRFPDEGSGCWKWNGAVTGIGYGNFWDGVKNVGAHLYSYKLFRGLVDKGLQVCHTCNDRRCVNPDHLYLGTAKDNAADRRSFKGEGSPTAQLTQSDVNAIRKLRENGAKNVDIAKQYNISSNHVSNIVLRRRWED